MVSPGNTRSDPAELRRIAALAELSVKSQWVGWKSVQRLGEPKATKLPVNPDSGGLADTTDHATWGTFDAALESGKCFGLDGVGFVFKEGGNVVGIELVSSCVISVTYSWDGLPLNVSSRNVYPLSQLGTRQLL